MSPVEMCSVFEFCDWNSANGGMGGPGSHVHGMQLYGHVYEV